MNYLDILSNIEEYPVEGAGSSSLPEFLTESFPPVLPEWVMRELCLGNLLKKNPNIVTHVDPDEEAYKAFFDGENRCASYNAQFDKLLSNPRLFSLMKYWRRNVRIMMGRVPKLKFDVSTSGATTNLGRGNSVLERFSRPEVTFELFEALTSFGPPAPSPLWGCVLKASLVKGNVAKCVPKTAFVSRLVNPEPCINASVQREQGLHLAKRCRLFGINIQDGQDRHRDMAWLASILGHLATDDQSNASGHIYSKLVQFLVSEDWWFWLNSSRSHFAEVERSDTKNFSHSHRLNVFATMGNGFCFELETIIFYALIWACVGKRHEDISVFGDDCIYPVEYVPLVHKAFKAVGFVINTSKSFSTGSFRESCGGDFLNGHNVRPIYLKRRFDDAYDLTIMANQIFSRFLQDQPAEWQVALYEKVVSLIDPKDRLWGPPCMGDAVLQTHDESKWCVKDVGKRTKRRLQRSWHLRAEDTTSFGKLIFEGASPDLAMRAVCSGRMKGWGLVKKFDKEGNGVVVYKQQPAAGTSYRAAADWGAFYTHSNRVDETNPLSVFDILKDTKCPPRIYSDEARIAEHRSLCEKFASLLSKLSENIGTPDIIDVVVDF